MGRSAGRAGLVAAGLIGGLIVGFVVWSREQVARKRDLFSKQPLRRLAALGYLAGRPTAETALLLREYVRWEQRPDLRRRATQLLRRVERSVQGHAV
jgi:hypothetical protein